MRSLRRYAKGMNMDWSSLLTSDTIGGSLDITKQLVNDVFPGTFSTPSPPAPQQMPAPPQVTQAAQAISPTPITTTPTGNYQPEPTSSGTSMSTYLMWGAGILAVGGLAYIMLKPKKGTRRR